MIQRYTFVVVSEKVLEYMYMKKYNMIAPMHLTTLRMMMVERNGVTERYKPKIVKNMWDDYYGYQTPDDINKWYSKDFIHVYI